MPTRISELLTVVPGGIEPKPPVPFEQTEEYREHMRAVRASRLRKAGLFGEYAEADTPQGQEAYERSKKGRGTFLFGPCGTGKTLSAACAVRLAVLDGKRAKLVTAKQLLDSVKAGYDGGDRGALDRAEAYDLLALDDLGVERSTEWALETITRLIDTRTTRQRPTIVTSNYRLGELRDRWGGVPGQRIVSRIAGACERVEMGGEDWRLK